MSFPLVYHVKWIYGLHMETNSLLEKYLGWLTSLRGSKEFYSPWNPEASGDSSSAVPHLIFQENSLPSLLAFHFLWLLSEWPLFLFLVPLLILPTSSKIREEMKNLFVPTSTSFYFLVTSLFSCLVVHNSLGPHGLQLARLPCPSPSPGFAQSHVPWAGEPSNHLILSSPSPPAFNLSQHQGLFQCWLFASGGQHIGASASSSVLPMKIEDLFTLELSGLILLAAHRTVKSLFQD